MKKLKFQKVFTYSNLPNGFSDAQASQANSIRIKCIPTKTELKGMGKFFQEWSVVVLEVF